MVGGIEAAGITAYYKSVKAIEDVNMVIQPRSVTALIGPANSGKSTFLRTINRTHEVFPGARVEGTLNIDGRNVYDRDVDPVTLRRMVGMVFQRPELAPTMSIYDNVVVGLRLENVRRRALLDEACERALRIVRLWDEVRDRLDLPSGNLPRGKQQQLSIARAIAVEPCAVLMDEPSLGLAKPEAATVEEVIHEVSRHHTVVIVTHNMQQAARVSHWTALFSKERTDEAGRLIEYSDTGRMFTNPTDRQTEDYITGRFG